MKYNQLGTTGLKVSNISLGTMTFGNEADKKESIKMFNICKDIGVNLFDCANKYSDGESEIILGECISSCRDEVIITTKAGSRISNGINSLGTSRKHLMLELEKSLKRLNTDYIDIYFLHYFDSYTSIEDSMRFLDEAIKQGKILYSGVSNWAAWQIMKSIHISKSNLLNKIDCIQPMYSLIKRQAEVEIFPLAQDQQLGVMTYSPIGSGLLTGKYEEIDKSCSARLYDKKYYNQRYSSEIYYETARKFCDFAKENSYEPSALAISWASNCEAVSSSIIGARNSTQLISNLESIKIDMTKELRDEISSLSIEPSPANDRLEEIIDEKNKLRF